MGVGQDVKVGDLTAEQVDRLTAILQTQFKTGPDVYRREKEHVKRLIRIGSEKMIRNMMGLPCNGQRNRANHNGIAAKRGASFRFRLLEIKRSDYLN